ncbi:ClC family H(+)/Cl(-) exchange transporter [Lacticaseibacillus sharpeae]|uniref:Chloride channel protein n=1 Tax=Lacticaseibacillus sharpeae JCM 1186 = DSM 20505 TaxID=1291052 RepID=A0A0R1ZRU2_9LACO|nr:ClC family H(+)/Cl(-) exchange transporter [Lacticaseibacillus sharpeae]KRM54699.1 chloride channel protein [Lacticaseibacillus sharpeae JCM 1186 = DSM 20505]
MQRKKSHDNTRFKFIITGLVIGAAAGFVVALFRLLIEKLLDFMKYLYMHPTPQIIIGIVIVSIIAGLFIALLVKQQPNISGSGIPQIEGQLHGDLDFNWWAILWRKFVAGVIGIGSGLFLGREGPSIQLGSAVGQGFADVRGKSGADRRVMIASGAAAGLSAAFNAPLAGTMFVLEEVYHNFSPLVWMTSLASAVAADLVSLNFFGLTPVLHLVYLKTMPVYMYWHIILLGILLGLLGMLYSKCTLAMPRVYALTHLSRPLQGLIPLLLVIPLGLAVPDLLGGGNSVILSFGAHVPLLWPLIWMFVIRFVFSMISYGSGLPGGIFLPILTLGAVIGGVYGVFMADMGLLPRVYIMNLIIFAMAGYFAGIGKAPFTAILLITEMVGSIKNLLPLALLSLTAFTVTDLLGGAPIYEALLSRLVLPNQLGRLHQPVRFELPIFAGATLDSAQVRDFQWPTDSLLVEIRRGDDRRIPHGDTVLRAGDTLVIMTDERHQRDVRKVIEKVAEAPET